MTDPTDAELLEFVARFAGWTDLSVQMVVGFKTPVLTGTFPRKCYIVVPDYLNSVDVWLRDVWPKIEHDARLRLFWEEQLKKVLNMERAWFIINADARSRCLALYRALEGKLPNV